MPDHQFQELLALKFWCKWNHNIWITNTQTCRGCACSTWWTTNLHLGNHSSKQHEYKWSLEDWCNTSTHFEGTTPRLLVCLRDSRTIWLIFVYCGSLCLRMKQWHEHSTTNLLKVWERLGSTRARSTSISEMKFYPTANKIFILQIPLDCNLASFFKGLSNKIAVQVI